VENSTILQNYSSIGVKGARAIVSIEPASRWQSGFSPSGGITTKTTIQNTPGSPDNNYLATASRIDYDFIAGSYQRFTTIVQAKDAVEIAYAIPNQIYNVELDLTYKLTRFEEVLGLFVDKKSRMIKAKIFLDIESYDYDLMQNIIEQVETPTQRKLGVDTLISFDYIYGDADAYLKSISIQEKCLFKRARLYGK
jgi:hypothetical protein